MPTEGATGWADTWMLVERASTPTACSCGWTGCPSPDAEQVAEYFGEAPANLEACPLMDPDSGAYGYKGFCDSTGSRRRTTTANIEFWKTPLADCGDARGTTCIDFRQWVERLDEIGWRTRPVGRQAIDDAPGPPAARALVIA